MYKYTVDKNADFYSFFLTWQYTNKQIGFKVNKRYGKINVLRNEIVGGPTRTKAPIPLVYFSRRYNWSSLRKWLFACLHCHYHSVQQLQQMHHIRIRQHR
jgi:hypothetical protein